MKFKVTRSQKVIIGILQKHAPIEFRGLAQVHGVPAIQGELVMTGFDVSALNQFLRSYLPLDVIHGKLDSYAEAIW